MIRPTTTSTPERSASPNATLLAGFVIAASIGAFWAVLLAMGQALRRAWPNRA